MTQYTCELLQNEITCFQNQIQSCCSSQLGPVYLPDYKGEPIDWDKLVKMKEDALIGMKNGDIPENCKGCFNLKPCENPPVKKEFSRLIISHWVHCNCSCVYCARNEFSNSLVTRVPKNSDFYDLFPILKGLYENNLLAQDGSLFVDFQGGDIAVLEEFEDIVKILQAHNAGYIRFTTNNIIYQPLIEKILKQNKGELMTSLDCGCAETYKKIKRVDKFEDAVKNLEKYRKAAPDAFVFVKYITVKGINDNASEVNKFLDLMTKLKVPAVSFEIDYRDIMMNPNKRFDIPAHYYELLEIFKKRCAENNIKLTLFTHTENVLKQGYFGENK